jgi:hypothetical protein
MRSSFPTRDNAHMETCAGFYFMVEGRGVARGSPAHSHTSRRVRHAPVEREATDLVKLQQPPLT